MSITVTITYGLSGSVIILIPPHDKPIELLVPEDICSKVTIREIED